MNYTVTLRIGPCSETLRLEAPLGDTAALRVDAQRLLEDGTLKYMVHEILEKLEPPRSEVRLDAGLRDTCGGTLGGDSTVIMTESLAGVVMCGACKD